MTCIECYKLQAVGQEVACTHVVNGPIVLSRRLREEKEAKARAAEAEQRRLAKLRSLAPK